MKKVSGEVQMAMPPPRVRDFGSSSHSRVRWTLLALALLFSGGFYGENYCVSSALGSRDGDRLIPSKSFERISSAEGSAALVLDGETNPLSSPLLPANPDVRARVTELPDSVGASRRATRSSCAAACLASSSSRNQTSPSCCLAFSVCDVLPAEVVAATRAPPPTETRCKRLLVADLGADEFQLLVSGAAGSPPRIRLPVSPDAACSTYALSSEGLHAWVIETGTSSSSQPVLGAPVSATTTTIRSTSTAAAVRGNRSSTPWRADGTWTEETLSLTSTEEETSDAVTNPRTVTWHQQLTETSSETAEATITQTSDNNVKQSAAGNVSVLLSAAITSTSSSMTTNPVTGPDTTRPETYSATAWATPAAPTAGPADAVATQTSDTSGTTSEQTPPPTAPETSHAAVTSAESTAAAAAASSASASQQQTSGTSPQQQPVWSCDSPTLNASCKAGQSSTFSEAEWNLVTLNATTRLAVLKNNNPGSKFCDNQRACSDSCAFALELDADASLPPLAKLCPLLQAAGVKSAIWLKSYNSSAGSGGNRYQIQLQGNKGCTVGLKPEGAGNADTACVSLVAP